MKRKQLINKNQSEFDLVEDLQEEIYRENKFIQHSVDKRKLRQNVEIKYSFVALKLDLSFTDKNEMTIKLKDVNSFHDWFIKNYFWCVCINAFKINPDRTETELIQYREFSTGLISKDQYIKHFKK